MGLVPGTTRRSDRDLVLVLYLERRLRDLKLAELAGRVGLKKLRRVDQRARHYERDLAHNPFEQRSLMKILKKLNCEI